MSMLALVQVKLISEGRNSNYFIYAVYNVNNYVNHYCRKITYIIQRKLSINQSFF